MAPLIIQLEVDGMLDGLDFMFNTLAKLFDRTVRYTFLFLIM